MLKRGVSPRIVSAEVLGSRGDTPVSGPELASRLGLQSAWAYFSVQNGTKRHARARPQRPVAATPAPVHSTGARAAPATPTGRPAVSRAAGGAVDGRRDRRLERRAERRHAAADSSSIRPADAAGALVRVLSALPILLP